MPVMTTGTAVSLLLTHVLVLHRPVRCACALVETDDSEAAVLIKAVYDTGVMPSLAFSMVSGVSYWPPCDQHHRRRCRCDSRARPARADGQRARIVASTLRARPARSQGRRRSSCVEAHVLPLVEAGRFELPIAATFPMAEAQAAYDRFERVAGSARSSCSAQADPSGTGSAAVPCSRREKGDGDGEAADSARGRGTVGNGDGRAPASQHDGSDAAGLGPGRTIEVRLHPDTVDQYYLPGSIGPFPSGASPSMPSSPSSSATQRAASSAPSVKTSSGTAHAPTSQRCRVGSEDDAGRMSPTASTRSRSAPAPRGATDVATVQRRWFESRPVGIASPSGGGSVHDFDVHLQLLAPFLEVFTVTGISADRGGIPIGSSDVIQADGTVVIAADASPCPLGFRGPAMHDQLRGPVRSRW